MKPGDPTHAKHCHEHHHPRRSFLKRSLMTLGAAALLDGSVAFATESGEKKKVYVCPPCGCASDGKEFDKPGQCPSCEFELVEKEPPAESTAPAPAQPTR